MMERCELDREMLSKFGGRGNVLFFNLFVCFWFGFGFA